MRGLETVLFGVAFLSELIAAGLIVFDIRENGRLRTETLSKPAPLSNALDQSPGILTRWSRDRFRADEVAASMEVAGRLRGAIHRQSWAFVALLLGATAAVAGNLLSVWLR